MTKTDLSTHAMLASQPYGTAKAGGPITGDGAFLAFWGQQTATVQDDNVSIAGKLATPPSEIQEPQLADPQVKAIPLQIPVADQQIAELALSAEAIRASDFHIAQKWPPLLPMPEPQAALKTLPAADLIPVLGTAQLPKQSMPHDTATTDKANTVPQNVDAVLVSFDTPPPVQQYNSLPMPPQHFKMQSAHSHTPSPTEAHGSDHLQQPTFPLGTATPAPVNTTTIMVSAPQAMTQNEPISLAQKEIEPVPEPLLNPATNLAAQRQPAGNILPTLSTDSAAPAHTSAFAPTLPTPPVSMLQQTPRPDLPAPKRNQPFAHPSDTTTDAKPTVATIVQSELGPVQNQPVSMGKYPHHTPLPPQPAPNSPPAQGVLGEPAKSVNFVKVSAHALPTNFAEAVLLPKSDVTSQTDETQLNCPLSSQEIAPTVGLENAQQAADMAVVAVSSSAATTAARTDRTGLAPVFALSELASDRTMPHQPRHVPLHLPSDVAISSQIHTIKNVTPETAALPSVSPLLNPHTSPRNMTQPALAPPMPQADEQFITPVVTLQDEVQAPKTNPSADQSVQVRTIQQPSPKIYTAQSVAPVDQDKPKGNAPEVIVKDIHFVASQQKSDLRTRTPTPSPNDLAAPIASPSGSAQKTEKKSLYEGVFAPTGFSPSASLPSVPQTSSLQPVPVPVSSIPEQIVTHARGGKPSTIELTLTPEDLGKIRLVMTSDGDRIRIMVHADRPETLDLIRRNTDSFSADLRQAGYSNTSFTFSGWTGRQSAQQDQKHTDHGFDSTTDDTFSAVAPAKPHATQPKLSGLNLRV